MSNVRQRESAASVEIHGIGTIPEEGRTGSPSDVVSILIGGNLALTLIVIGWLPVAFGLGWWGSLSALLVGVLIGAIVLAPASLFGPRTGTNNAVSSGAHFGVVGRFIGSVLALASALGFTALTVWTSGDALLAAGHRLLGTPASDTARGVCYALISALLIVIAIYGFRLLVLAQQVMIPLMGIVLLLGLIAFAPKFDAGYQGGDYLLGNFWNTWALSVLIAYSTIAGYGPFVGDWTRYISRKRYSDKQIVRSTFVGTCIGMSAAYVFGAFTAVCFTDPTRSYAESLVLDAPGWYILPIMLLGIGAGAAQGATGLYGTGLDTSSLIPRLSRLQATALLGVVAVALVYLGVFVWNVVDSLSAFVTLLGIVAIPWLGILYYGMWWRRGAYDPEALQVFMQGRSGGRYWFTRGVNLQATVAWVVGSIVGILCSDTSLLHGPWAGVAGGIDVSTIAAGVVGVGLYVVLLAAFPEPAEAFVGVPPRGRDVATTPTAPMTPVAPAETDTAGTS